MYNEIVRKTQEVLTMKKDTNKLLKGLIISAVTFLAGYAITMLSFNFFENITINQMRAVFAADITALIITGCIAYFFYENKKAKEAKRKATEKRRLERVEALRKEKDEINRIIFQANKVA